MVDIKNGRFYLLFLRLIWDFARDWLQQKMWYLVLMHFIVDFAQKWLRKKTFLLAFVAFYRWFCVCCVTVGANILVHFLVLDRPRTPVTVEADILSSSIVFHDWFCKRVTAEADFLGSCRKYILSFIFYGSCWRSTEIFLIFFFKYFNIDFMSNWLLE